MRFYLVNKVRNSERLNLNDGILLYNHLDIFELGLLATCLKKQDLG